MQKIMPLPSFLRKRLPLFQYAPSFDKVDFCGLSKERIFTFQTEENGEKGKLFFRSFIRKEESDIWKGCQELVGSILLQIEPKISGILRFELISIEMSEDFEKFQWHEFAQGMTDLSKKLGLGETQFVQYCSLFGTLTKHAYEDFGKITFTPLVSIFDREPAELSSVLERMIRELQKDDALSGRRQLIFYDLSRTPMYNPQNALQMKALKKMSDKIDNDPSTTLDEVGVIDSNGYHRIFIKSQLEMDLFNS